MADPIVMDQLFHSFLIFFNHLVRTEVDRNFCFETIRGNNYFPKEKSWIITGENIFTSLYTENSIK